jgi:2-(1,2-epoxy-1,2-dihydrophenyl)acetyl-CoA isomerase
MSESVTIECDHGIATIYLNRPERLNALDLETATSLRNALEQLASQGGISAVVVSGRGRAFCAGGDLAWVARFPGGMRSAIQALATEFHHSIRQIREMRKPVIAAINGVAAGGGFSLALACDFRVMTRDGMLRHAYGSAGLSMDGGASFLLPRLVGSAKALEIAAFDSPITPDRAAALGLVTKVTEGSAVDAAVAMAGRLSDRALESFGWSKQLFNASWHSTPEAQLALECRAIVECVGGVEGREGVAAFSEKRHADFVSARASARRQEE